MNIYFDCEFTGLHQKTTLISIGLISDCGKTFYAEFTDYDKAQVSDWVKENVIEKLKFGKERTGYGYSDIYQTHFKGDSTSIKSRLNTWFSQFEKIDIWSDCLSYDWVLFNNLLADYSDGYPQLPRNINYIPFDICTLFKIKGIDPDISREEYAKEGGGDWFSDEVKHNALFDARVIKICYNKLIKI